MNVSISFAQEVERLAELSALLMQEQSGLIMGDMDAIESLALKKSRLLQVINGLSIDRYELLAKLGYEASEAGMKVWLATQKQAALILQWEAFQAELTQAKEVNRLNGLLINKHFHRNQQMLNVLQGVNADSIRVYGPNGQPAPANFTRGALVV